MRSGSSRCLPLLGFAALIAACAEPGQNAKSRQPPRLHLAAEAHDFGRVGQGAAIRHTFQVTNDGDLDLEILRLRNAGDVRAEVVGSREVAAGESRGIEVEFDTTSAFGPQRRTVTVYSNDPDRRVASLSLSGEVVLVAAADPSALYVGTVRRGERVAQELRVLHSVSVRIDSLTTQGPYLEIISAAPVSDETGRPVAIRVMETAPVGPFTQEIAVRSNSRVRPSFNVAVTGTVGHMVDAFPPELRFGPVGADGARALATLVENHGERPMAITQADIDPADLARASLETIRKGFLYRLRVTLGDTPSGADTTGIVRLRTTAGADAVVEIPIIVAVQNQQDPLPKVGP